MRADHDGHSWWSTYWPTHPELMTNARKREFNAVAGYLLEVALKKGMPDIAAICKAHPQTVVGDPTHGEYNFFVEGNESAYWVRLIMRPRDYNLYLHGYVKPSKNGGVRNES